MSSRELNKLKWQRPFKPFRITTVNNEVFDITQPGLILVGKHDINIGIPHRFKPLPAVRDVIWLGVEDVVSVEFIEPAKT
jgi:hypothetical protein